MQKSEFLHLIQDNITAHGYHVTVVTGGALPRYAYTIGCVSTVGAELVFAGGEYYSQAQVGKILDAFASHPSRESIGVGFSVRLGLLGTFTLAPVDASWRNRVLLGAVDYHTQSDWPAWQIVPEGLHRTLDVPEMAQTYDATVQPVWQWLDCPWPYPVPSHSMALTEVQVLRGGGRHGGDAVGGRRLGNLRRSRTGGSCSGPTHGAPRRAAGNRPHAKTGGISPHRQRAMARHRIAGMERVGLIPLLHHSTVFLNYRLTPLSSMLLLE
ncbi:DUF4262 domain-containing protein [Hymenobacter persicinus]